MVSAPQTPQAANSQPGLPMFRAIPADTMKIPDPIMTPTTSMVASNKPRPRANSPPWFEARASLVSFLANKNHLLFTASQSHLTGGYCIHNMEALCRPNSEWLWHSEMHKLLLKNPFRGPARRIRHRLYSRPGPRARSRQGLVKLVFSLPAVSAN